MHRNEYRKAPLDISPDGRYLLFLETDAISRNLMILDLEMDEVQPLLTSSADESGGRFSPDGEWVAFTSDESGRLEVYLERFPDRGERFQVSTEGGHEPVFRANGRELFYESTQGELMAVSVNMDAPRDPLGEPSRLFRTRLRYGGYDVASDGQSFILDRFILVEVTALVLTQEPLAAAH